MFLKFFFIKARYSSRYKVHNTVIRCAGTKREWEYREKYARKVKLKAYLRQRSRKMEIFTTKKKKNRREPLKVWDLITNSYATRRAESLANEPLTPIYAYPANKYFFCIGLKSNNYFTGSLKYVFFNEISILYELKKGNPKVHYIGLLEPEFGDLDVESIPLTFPFYSSHIWWFNENFNTSGCFTLTFDFRSYKNLAVLAAAEVTTETGEGYWEVSFWSINWQQNCLKTDNTKLTMSWSITKFVERS